MTTKLYTVRTLVFVSGPLSLGDRKYNCQTAVDVGKYLVSRGYSVYVPHLWNDHDGDDSLGYENWLEVDMSFIHACNAVLRIMGVSLGADKECYLAEELGKPVFYTTKELLIKLPPTMQIGQYVETEK